MFGESGTDGAAEGSVLVVDPEELRRDLNEAGIGELYGVITTAIPPFRGAFVCSGVLEAIRRIINSLGDHDPSRAQRTQAGYDAIVEKWYGKQSP